MFQISIIIKLPDLTDSMHCLGRPSWQPSCFNTQF